VRVTWHKDYWLESVFSSSIASKLSIAFGIAQALHREGAELAFTYPNEKLKNV
jgi:enoyl-[acyl-carrier-protein] reductase (NADH)